MLAVVGGFALGWVGGRVTAVAARTGEQVDSIVATLDQTSFVLSSMGASATSFSGTLERTPPAVRQTAQTVVNLRANLTLVEGQLSAINILGARPLANAANLFGQMATDLEGLDTRLETIAADLDTNRAALVDNSARLAALGTELNGLADDLRGGVIEDSLADVQLILSVLSVLLIVWALLPAVGALFLGLSIRRELRHQDDSVVAP
jgi:ABC-type transporter Mla subunit MlaD